jgi:hypothetical protein
VNWSNVGSSMNLFHHHRVERSDLSIPHLSRRFSVSGYSQVGARSELAALARGSAPEWSATIVLARSA